MLVGGGGLGVGVVCGCVGVGGVWGVSVGVGVAKSVLSDAFTSWTLLTHCGANRWQLAAG